MLAAGAVYATTRSVARSIRSCARSNQGLSTSLTNRRSGIAGTIARTSNRSIQRANPNIVRGRIERCRDEIAADNQPAPNGSLGSGSTTVRPCGYALAQRSRRRSNPVVEGPFTGSPQHLHVLMLNLEHWIAQVCR